MESISKAEVVDFLKSLNLPESKFLINGEIVDIYTLLGIEPQFHKDGTRVLTPYEIIGIPPRFSDDGKELPIVFILKNKCKKIGNYEGKSVDFVCKNNKVKDSKDTLDELKSRYKVAVLSGDEETASDLFAIIDKLSGGNARDLLSSFFNYAKFYKKMQKQLLIDMFAHFFMMYIYARVKAAKGGLVRKNRIYKPFKTAFVQTQTVLPNQNQNQTATGSQSAMPITQAPVELPKVEVVSVESLEDGGLNPESFGIKNLKSITIEHGLPTVDEVVEVPVEEVPPQIPVMPIIPEENKTANNGAKEEKKSGSGEYVRKESKGIIESMVDFFSFGDKEDKSPIETEKATQTESFDDLSANDNNLIDDAEFGMQDFNQYSNLSNESEMQTLDLSESVEQSTLQSNEPSEYEQDYYSSLNSENLDEMIDEKTDLDIESSKENSDDDGEHSSDMEVERTSELKSKKHITVKKYGVEFNPETNETKVENEQQPELEAGQEYDFEG